MERNKELCLEMWRLLRENPRWEKEDALKEMGFKPYDDNYPHASCFACEEVIYGLDKDTEKLICEECPINFRQYIDNDNNFHSRRFFCLNLKSPYQIWNWADNLDIRKSAANQMVILIEQTWED